MGDRGFSSEMDEYIVLKLELKKYERSQRSLPKGLVVASPGAKQETRSQEMRLLKQYFQNWEVPYYGRLIGWREDSAVFVLENRQLVGGIYLCDRNIFDNDLKWGQLHYAFMDPEYKGLGIFSVIFRVAVERAQVWGLEGLYLSSDRHGLPELYERWGAVYWKRIDKRWKRLWKLVQVLRQALPWT
jgi:GNAT superfamily N-acetyltransferase